MEVSTYVYIDCLSLFTCSSYYSMRGVVYGGVTAFIMLMAYSCNLCLSVSIHGCMCIVGAWCMMKVCK